MAEQDFVINEYLSLRLENNQTNIYVKGNLFTQCKYLLLTIPVKKIDDVNEISSIDEAAEKLNSDMEENHLIIPPEVEFFGHCSNLQAWYEHKYDTNLLHRNIAFPLLKQLTFMNDPLAKKVFKEEIAKRIETGYKNIIYFFNEEGYLKYFTEEEKQTISQKSKCIIFESFIAHLSLQELDLSNSQLRSLPESIGNLSSLQRLDLSNSQLSVLPIIKKLKKRGVRVY